MRKPSLGSDTKISLALGSLDLNGLRVWKWQWPLSVCLVRPWLFCAPSVTDRHERVDVLPCSRVPPPTPCPQAGRQQLVPPFPHFLELSGQCVSFSVCADCVASVCALLACTAQCFSPEVLHHVLPAIPGYSLILSQLLGNRHETVKPLAN